MGWGLQPPLAASATRASGLIAGPEPAQSLSLLHSPSTLVYNKTKLYYYILDTDPQPSAALKALPASARKMLRVSPPRHGGYAALPAIAYAMGWGLWPQVAADAAKPAHTHGSWLYQLPFRQRIRTEPLTRIGPVPL